MVLHEIPGALERPADCGIAIRKDGGVTTIDIPPSRLSRFTLLYSTLYGMLLLLFVVTGIVVYTTGKAILILNWIGFDHTHPMFRKLVPFSLPLWAFLAWIGGSALVSVLRPSLQRERITIDKSGVTLERKFLRRKMRRHIVTGNMQGFLLRKDDAGMRPEVITMVGRGESVEIGEFLRPAEREWLVSAGNALLRAL